MKNYLLLFGLLFFQFSFINQSFAQVFSSGENKNSAISNIESLQKGILIVPLFEQSNKFQQIQALIDDPQISEKYKRKLIQKIEKEKIQNAEFNRYIVHHILNSYKFSRIYFVNDSDLQSFNPSSLVIVNPVTMKADSTIKLTTDNYYFLKYYKTSGVASSPDEIRFFYIMNKDLKLLARPFPNSPGRRSTFSMRFKDLLNINPNPDELISLLVIKLNRNLYRYLKSKT